jgi:hypothetical protein
MEAKIPANITLLENAVSENIFQKSRKDRLDILNDISNLVITTRDVYKNADEQLKLKSDVLAIVESKRRARKALP